MAESVPQAYTPQLDEEERPSDDSIIRCVSSTHVLENFGEQLRHNVGTAETYALSEPCTSFDAFLSHSWRDSGLLKYLALSYYYNRDAALLTTATVAGVILVIQIMINLLSTQQLKSGLLTPLASFPSFCPGDNERIKSADIMLPSIATFYTVLFFGHRFPSLIRPTRMFLGVAPALSLSQRPLSYTSHSASLSLCISASLPRLLSSRSAQRCTG